MPLDNSLNRDILHSLHIHRIFSCDILDGEGTDGEESNMRFSYSIPMEMTQGLKRIWDSEMGGTPSLSRIIEDVDRPLEASEIVFHGNSASVEGLADINGYRRKELGEGKSVSWGGAQTKGEVRKCKQTKNMFF